MNQSVRHFLSIKWKALSVTGTLFAIVAVAFFYSGKTYIDLQFEQSRAQAVTQYRAQTQVLIEQAALRLRQLANSIISLQGMEQPLLEKEKNRVAQAFENHWWKFQVDSSVESAAFFDVNGEEVGYWGAQLELEELVEQVRQEESPVWQVQCSNSCRIVTLTPVYIFGEFRLVVALASSFSDVIEKFNRITKADMALMLKNKTKVVDEKNYFVIWDMKLAAASNKTESRKLLKELEAQKSFASLLPESVQLDSDSAGSYEISVMPIADMVAGSEGQLIAIADITQAITNQQSLVRDTSIVAVVGLVGSELILLGLLWRPTTRLRRVTDILPLLASNDFETARKEFIQHEKEPWMIDESDILRSTAVSLSYQLETLQTLANNRAEQLQNRSRELEQEKNFIESLLNTAHALILTQDSEGNILNINEYGCMTLGKVDGDIIGTNYYHLLPRSVDVSDAEFKLQKLIAGEVDEVRHEAPMRVSTNDVRYMSWSHSVLPSPATDGVTILTMAIDINERREAEENLNWLASHDSLTGLINRRRFEEELELMIAEANRYHHSGALLFFDLDQFKDVNDSSGHQTGDELLKKVANTLKNAARESDVLARLGGDEFAILISEADMYSAGEAAERYLKELMKVAIPGKSRIHRISASIGVAVFPEHGNSAEELLSNADIAMYRAKDNGRNCWVVFNEQEFGKELIHERVFWNDKVKQVLSDNNFDMYFQPIMEIESGKISHYELLMRLFDENNQVLPPDKFISAAERSGQMIVMDERVIEKAIVYQAKLAKLGVDARLSINLSGLSFKNENLLTHINSCLDKYQVNPKRIIFEITETAAVADLEVAIRVMHAVREMGCEFALDDFGVGFSSLHYLKQLPVDYVKIDGSFIRRLHTERDDQVLVKALVEISKVFGQFTVAEFVDNEEVLETLRSLGVDYAQGYLIDKPQPFEQLWPAA